MRKEALFLCVAAGVIVVGCGSAAMPIGSGGGGFEGSADGGTVVGAGTMGRGRGAPLPPGPDASNGGTSLLPADASLDALQTTSADPQTCDEAAQEHSYIGCDYWPTVVANNVWSVFDFAVVVANAGQTAADVTITGPSNTNQSTTVPPGQLVKLYLPWVPALKGPDADACGSSMPLAASVKATASAFHLVSSMPVTVYQFNALEYAGMGGPPGKNWSLCPGNSPCNDPASANNGATVGCFSFSNDASLLLPSTAMTGNYRVIAHEGVILVDAQLPGQMLENDAYVAVTGTQDGTTVSMKLSTTAQIAAGGGIPATNAGGTITFDLNAGDVVELTGTGGSDLSGSLVEASAPVQVITGMPCVDVPPLQPACDHVEESVVPAETLGKDYVVTRPAGPSGAVVPHQVRIYGHVDGTQLTYDPSPPAGCPATINAGQVVECGNPACPKTVDINQTIGTNCGVTSQDFEVTGDQPFAVGTYTLGATVVDPQGNEGDPAQSFATAVEQYRTKYVFLAPSDYTVSFVDIIAKQGTTLTLDARAVTTAPVAVGNSGYSIYRVELGAGQAGAHVLTASLPVGIQVVGYGSFTSYMYPGGLDLQHIAPPPPPIQ